MSSVTNHINPPFFSLVIATRNRPEQLTRLLSSLQKQTFRDFEVIVVDQSSHGIDASVRKVINIPSLNITYIRDTGTGLSRARNIGMRAAQGQVLAFPDDDCWYAQDLLERVANTFIQNPRLCLLSGCYSEPGRRNLRFPEIALPLNLYNVFSCVSSVTIFIRREATRGIEFNEKLGVGTSLPAGEEVDFVIKVLNRGCKGLYDPSIVIFHKINRPSTTVFDFVIRREQANAYVLLRNALESRSYDLWIRFIDRTARDLLKNIWTNRGRQVLLARLRGYFQALQDRGN